MPHPDPDYFGEFVFLRKAGAVAPSSVRVALPADSSLDELLEEFACFLRAVGYHVPEDHVLDFVPMSGACTSCDPHLRAPIASDGTTAEDTDQ